MSVQCPRPSLLSYMHRYIQAHANTHTCFKAPRKASMHFSWSLLLHNKQPNCMHTYLHALRNIIKYIPRHTFFKAPREASVHLSWCFLSPSASSLDVYSVSKQHLYQVPESFVVYLHKFCIMLAPRRGGRGTGMEGTLGDGGRGEEGHA